MLEDTKFPLETAEERAKRMWRNNQITHKIKEPETKRIPVKSKDNTEQVIAHIKHIFRQEIIGVFENKQRDILTEYAAAIRHKRRLLMIEKLRRLELKNE